MFLQGLHSTDPTTQKVTSKLMELTIHQCLIPMAENMRIIVPALEVHMQHKPLCTDLLTGHAASKDIHLCKRGTTPIDLANQLLPKKIASALGADIKASNHGFQVYLFKTYGDILGFKKGVGTEPEWVISHIPEVGSEELQKSYLLYPIQSAPSESPWGNSGPLGQHSQQKPLWCMKSRDGTPKPQVKSL